MAVAPGPLIPLQPSGKFNFKSPDEWPRWIKRFEQFRLASGLDKESEERQASTLLYCLGEDAEDVLLSTGITPAERKKYTDVLSKFNEFFKVRKNVIFERARFNRRGQQEGESAEEFIAALFNLAENCDYGAMKEELIRDRLVAGIKDDTLSQRLQLDASLTLEKAKKAVRQKEAVYEQQQALKGSSKSNPVELDELRRAAFSTRRPPGKPTTYRKCTCCGRGPHSKERCPARAATCHACQKKGHYRAMCHSKTVAALDAEEEFEEEEEEAYLNEINSNGQACWTAKIRVCSQDIPFKLDTGAEVTAISEKCYADLKNPRLRKPTKVLYGPGRKPLDLVGEMTTKVSYKGMSSTQQIFVVRGLNVNLLGLPAITALRLAVRLDSTTSHNDYDTLVKDRRRNDNEGVIQRNVVDPADFRCKGTECKLTRSSSYHRSKASCKIGQHHLTQRLRHSGEGFFPITL